MVATIVAAAHHLDPPTYASTTSQAWENHYLRRREIQFLCRANIDISKIQMGTPDAHFCHYFQIHGQPRKPHRTASAHGSCHRQRPLATPLTGCQVATSVEGPSATHHSKRGCASGEAAPPPTDTPFVAVARLRAAVHAKCPYRPGRARCGWAWSASRAVHHLYQPINFLPSDGCQASVCTRCRAAVTDSESSDREVARGASSTSGA